MKTSEQWSDDLGAAPRGVPLVVMFKHKQLAVRYKTEGGVWKCMPRKEYPHGKPGDTPILWLTGTGPEGEVWLPKGV